MRTVFLLCALAAMAECSVMRRVVNGHPISYGDWPFMVSLHYQKPTPFTAHSGMTHLCGGTLIDKNWILTAAHCVSDWTRPGMGDASNWKAVMGDYNQFMEDSGEQERSIDAIFMHPDYTSGNQLNDIALLRMSEPAEVSQYVGIMNINTENYKDQSRLHCIVGGWGQRSREPYGWGSYIPEIADVFIIGNQQCRAAYMKVNRLDLKMSIYIDDSVLCAGIPPEKQSMLKDENNDACDGDSGGPLICKTGNEGEWRLTGVVSYPVSCGRDDFPGLYNRVSYFKDWIEEIVNGRTNDEPTFENSDDVDISSSKSFGNVYA